MNILSDFRGVEKIIWGFWLRNKWKDDKTAININNGNTDTVKQLCYLSRNVIL